MLFQRPFNALTVKNLVKVFQTIRGRTVPVATNAVTFSVTGSGKLLGLGNGDPSCPEPDKGKQHSAFNGLCLAIIQSGREW
jgi:beta-galactosidase